MYCLGPVKNLTILNGNIYKRLDPSHIFLIRTLHPWFLTCMVLFRQDATKSMKIKCEIFLIDIVVDFLLF